MKSTATLIMVLVIFVTPAIAADVVMPDLNLYPITATTYMVKATIEEALGLEVKMVKTESVPIIWTAISRGKGEMDIWTEVWLPNQAGFVDRYVKKEKTVKTSGKSYPIQQGCYIPKAISEKYGITSVFDLVNPEISKVFDSDGDGKGEYWVGPQGWQSTNMEIIRARDYGIADFFELQSTDENIANAQLDLAIKAGKGWVGYFSSPHQNFALYDMVILKEPPYDPKKFVMVQPAQDPEWKSKSKVTCAYPPTTSRIGWSATLDKRQPQLVPLLKQIQLSVSDINQFSMDLANGGDPDVIARKWVKANRQLITEWMSK